MDKADYRAARKTLIKAKNLLINIGWSKNSMYTIRPWVDSPTKDSDYTGFCAYGAIRRANGSGERDAARMLSLVIGKMSRSPEVREFGQLGEQSAIFCFNDHPSTKKETILKAFDRAIKMAEKNEK